MSGELRAQRREPCARAEIECSWVEDGEECPAPDEHCLGEPGERIGDEAPCRGCNGDGTRWVTVGTVEVTTMHPTDLGWRGDADDRIAVFYPEEAA